MKPPAILYCHSQHAKVLPEEVENAVLRKVCAPGLPSEAVADLRDVSARPDPAILYCHRQSAKLLREEVRHAGLRQLCEAAQPCEAVADLCGRAARKDPTLARLAARGPVKLAACFPRAVKWLFAAATAPLERC